MTNYIQSRRNYTKSVNRREALLKSLFSIIQKEIYLLWLIFASNALSLLSPISDGNSSEPTKQPPDHLPTVLLPFRRTF